MNSLNSNIQIGQAISFASRIFAILLIFYTILTTAWIGDDAQITFRQVWNFINGDGITFNFEDRVQAFTHPLWFLILSFFSFITGELFLTTIIISIVFTMIAILLLFGIEYKSDNGFKSFASPVFLLLLSWAFIDYSTSGLENTLSFFLTGLILYVLSREKQEEQYTFVFVLLALLVLNRFDYSVLFLPLVLLLFFKIGKFGKIVRAVWPGAIILLTWLIFATLYFGSPLPNTYYAKLHAGYPTEEIVHRGRDYFGLLRQDFGTIIIILAGLIVSIVARNLTLISLSLGQLFYMYYIYSVGGDFMQGRFFAILVYLSTGIIILGFFRNNIFNFTTQKLFLYFTLILVLIFCKFNNYPKNYYNYPYFAYFEYINDKSSTKISDERNFYYKTFGLLSHHRTTWPVISNQSSERPQSYRITCGFLGQISIIESSKMVIDICGLSDPFIARIPAVQSGRWVIGHHFRKLPTGYGDFLTGKSETVEDKNLQNLLDDISQISRGELFSVNRFAAIWRLNSNAYENINTDIYRDTSTFVPKSLNSDDLITLKNWDDKIEVVSPAPIFRHSWNIETREFNTLLTITSRESRESSRIDLSVDNQHTYEIYVNDNLVETLHFGRETWEATINLPNSILVKKIEIKSVNADYFNISGPSALMYLNVI